MLVTSTTAPVLKPESYLQSPGPGPVSSLDYSGFQAGHLWLLPTHSVVIESQQPKLYNTPIFLV